MSALGILQSGPFDPEDNCGYEKLSTFDLYHIYSLL